MYNFKRIYRLYTFVYLLINVYISELTVIVSYIDQLIIYISQYQIV